MGLLSARTCLLGTGQQPGKVRHRALNRATSHLHHGGDPAPSWGDHDRSLGEIWEGWVIRRDASSDASTIH